MNSEQANSKKEWEAYRKQELNGVLPLLKKHGYILDADQIHIKGERYLMSGNKLVLIGHHKKNKRRVVIKLSSNLSGTKEILRERACRTIIQTIDFTYRAFFLPEEILFIEKNGYTISITAYIKQAQHFIDRPLEEQFFLSLRAFEMQEGAHVTTYAQEKSITDSLEMRDVKHYLSSFEEFKNNVLATDPSNTHLIAVFEKATKFLKEGTTIIERYSGFLTHSDFVPHNLRIVDNTIYLLDHTSLYFGNKYESWARFINFMVHHNPLLEHMLMTYVRQNRNADEYLTLRIMRVYKLGFLLQYYTGTLEKTSGDMQKLMRLRLAFWTRVLEAVLDDKHLPNEIVCSFLEEENVLRSEEEWQRRKEIISACK